MNWLREPSKRTLQALFYLAASLCAAMLVLGALAAIFDNALVVRIYGGLTAAVALIVGGSFARRAWLAASATSAPLVDGSGLSSSYGTLPPH